MSKHRRIYLLSPKDYSPETIAVAFAKTSRSPKPFDEIAAELSDESSARFHEKWVVGYGHGSVAEHAVLHLALENVSRLAIESIEGNRLASYTEKSTRYQKWDLDAFYIPEELSGLPIKNEYVQTCQHLFKTYENCLPKVKRWLAKTQPQRNGETESVFERRLIPGAVDICRFLLPAASLANVGMTINARALEYAIIKLLSSPLEEVRAIGERLREVGQLETPTLIKYASHNAYLASLPEKISVFNEQFPNQQVDKSDFRILSSDPDGEARVLAAILFRFGQGTDYQACFNYVTKLSAEQKENLVKELMEEKGKFDQPIRELEYAQLTFQAVMDQGAYFEFKRHRMMTQTVQPLLTDLGFAIPKGIIESGCQDEYLAAMRQAAHVYDQLKSINADIASYVVPNGYNRRVLFTMNLREMFHFCRVRAANNAHFSIQRVAHRLAEIVNDIYPLFGRYLDLPEGSTWQSVEKDFFTALNTN